VAKILTGLYDIDTPYLQHLRQYGDESVYFSDYHEHGQARKFYYGPVYTDAQGVNFFAPITKNTEICEHKLIMSSTQGSTLGGLHLGRMVPCPDEFLIEKDIESENSVRRKNRLYETEGFCFDNHAHTFDPVNKKHSGIEHMAKLAYNASADPELRDKHCVNHRGLVAVMNAYQAQMQRELSKTPSPKQEGVFNDVYGQHLVDTGYKFTTDDADAQATDDLSIEPVTAKPTDAVSVNRYLNSSTLNVQPPTLPPSKSDYGLGD
jgi:hypothetical protein